MRVDDVERAAGGRAELFHDVGVDHRRLDVGVPEVVLNLADAQPQLRHRGQRTGLPMLVDDGSGGPRAQSVRLRKLVK